MGSKRAQKGSVNSVRSVREKTFTKYVSSLIGVTSHITPLPVGEGLGEGPPPHGLETVRKWVLLNLWVLGEKKLPSKSQAFFLTWRVRSLSHRRTQMNRTHKGQKDSGPSLYPNRSPLRVLLFKPTRHCFVVPSLSLQQVFSVVKNHYISPN